MRIRIWAWSALILLCPLTGRGEETNTLTGRVVDALTGAPVRGAVVSTTGRVPVVTDEEGIYRIGAQAGTYRLTITHPSYQDAEMALQRPGGQDSETGVHLWPRRVEADFSPGPATFGIGQGTGLGPLPSEIGRWPGSFWLSPVPDALPETIRVARYRTSGCSGTWDTIDTIDFEDYVKGVVNAEVGVFQGVDGGPDAAMESWKAFAVAARSYALHFILTQPYDGYDINDTACNQVYKDDRNANVNLAVEATRGQILVKRSDPDVIDRYFYAASCNHHGTEPAYGTGTIIPDPTPVHGCVGSWCGHDACAGHADNPDLPGDDRCLVWGTCQWGSIERSMGGQTHIEILEHYQPDCLIRTFGETPSDGGADADTMDGSTMDGSGSDRTDADGGDTGADETAESKGGCTCTTRGRSNSLLLLFLLLPVLRRGRR